MASLKSYFALQEIKKPEWQKYIAYSYFLREDGKMGYFIPLYISSTQQEVDKRAEEIVEETNHPNIWTSPMGKWIPLGIDEKENVFPVNIGKEFKGEVKRQEKETDRIRAEQERIDDEIREEREAYDDDDSIESYYHDWVCAVQDQDYIKTLREHITSMEEEYNKRISNIRRKKEKNPEHERTWRPLLAERLKRRGEEQQFDYLERRSFDISKEESIS